MTIRSVLPTLAVIAFLTACKKDSDQPPPPPPPVIEPLTIAAAKPGDTLYIKGDNFSDVAEKNAVQFNGTAATVITASTTELKVVVPANAQSGPITVTVNGVTVEVGNITVVPFTVLVYKRNYKDQDNELRQIFTINPATGQETLFYTLTDNDGYNVEDMVYVPATNELIGLTGANDNVLFRLNISSKQATYTPMQTGANSDFMELVVDKFSNLYSINRNWNDPNHYMQSLVKIDPKTGAYSAVKTFEYGAYWSELAYVSASDEVIGLTGVNEILKLNLSTKDTSRVYLPVSDSEDYRGLTADNKSNVYVFKANWADPTQGIGQIFQANISSGQTSLITTFNDYTNIRTNLLILPQNNELATVWDDGTAYSLYKLDIGAKSPDNVVITNDRVDVSYRDLTCN